MSPRRPRARAPKEVLERRPWLVEAPVRSRPLIDTVDQLEELAALFDQGLISRTAFEEQKRKVLGA
jgi:Short C-terminal domain